MQRSPALPVASVVAALAGAALPFAFAPTHWWPLAPLSLAIFYLLLVQRPPRQAAWLGWCFGLGYYGLGVSWVYHSIHLFGEAVAPLAAAVTALFVLVMTVFPALVAALMARLTTPRALMAPLLFAALWVVSELARGKIMGGFPWILVGYSQIDTWLSGFAPWLGVYGVGFVLVLISAVVARALLVRSLRAGLLACGVVVVCASLAVAADRVSWTAPKARDFTVHMIQANIPQALKFSRERLQTSLNDYVRMSREALRNAANSGTPLDLIVWPETAIPTYYDRVEAVMEPVMKPFDAAGVGVLTGVFHREDDNVYNAIVELGGQRQVYHKRHLVPFGEYMPMRFLLDGLAAYIEIPMSDIASGAGPQDTMMIRGEPIGLSICYEDVYGEEMRAALPEASVLINVSNDAWFGDSAAPHQHEQKARMRAREFERPLIRVTNTGVSSGMDHRGQVLVQIPHNQLGAASLTVTPRTGATLYARTGNWPIGILVWVVVIFALCVRWRGQVASRLI